MIRRAIDTALMVLVALMVTALVWAYAVPPAHAAPATPDDLGECTSALWALDDEAFDLREDLDEATRALVLVEGDRARLVDEVDRLNRQVVRLRARLAAARR